MLVVFAITQKPYIVIMLNKMEIFNESTILLLAYLTFGFSDYQDDPEAIFNVGWAYCGIIIANILINFFTICYVSIYLPILRYCRGHDLRRREYLRKKLEKR